MFVLKDYQNNVKKFQEYKAFSDFCREHKIVIKPCDDGSWLIDSMLFNLARIEQDESGD